MPECKLSGKQMAAIGELFRSMSTKHLVYKGKPVDTTLEDEMTLFASTSHLIAHRHPYPEYCVMIEGRSFVELDGSYYPMTRGSVCYIPGGVNHNIYWNAAGATCSILWMAFADNKLRMHVTSYRNDRYHVTDGVDLTVDSLLPDLVDQEFARRKEHYLDHILSYLTSFWYSVIRKHEALHEQGAPQPDWKTKIVSEVDEYLFKHVSDKITLKELSDAVKLSPNYLSYLFKEIRGVNLFDYIHAQKIERAKELLKIRSLNVAEIAYLVGYKDPFYFTKIFKKVVGDNPSQFRKHV